MYGSGGGGRREGSALLCRVSSKLSLARCAYPLPRDSASTVGMATCRGQGLGALTPLYTTLSSELLTPKPNPEVGGGLPTRPIWDVDMPGTGVRCPDPETLNRIHKPRERAALQALLEALTRQVLLAPKP